MLTFSLSQALTIIGLSFEAISFIIAIKKNLFLSKEIQNHLKSEKVAEERGRKIVTIPGVDSESLKQLQIESVSVTILFIIGCILQGIALFF